MLEFRWEFELGFVALEFEFMLDGDVAFELFDMAALLSAELPAVVLPDVLVWARAAPPAMPSAPEATAVSLRMAFMRALRWFVARDLCGLGQSSNDGALDGWPLGKATTGIGKTSLLAALVRLRFDCAHASVARKEPT